jgi:DNA-binding Lrp family transcriptional regulator
MLTAMFPAVGTSRQDRPAVPYNLDAVDRLLVRATQSGLMLAPRPYHQLAELLDLSPEEVMARLRAMHDSGVIRRIGVVPNHYMLGYKANGMTVWDVADDCVDGHGKQVGKLDFVSHCYRRPRRLPMWPYNLFAMVHGRDRGEVEKYVEEISSLLGDACRARDILYSTDILKKTGLRIGA